MKGTAWEISQSTIIWASLVAQMVKNLPAMWETWVQSLGWEDPVEEGMSTNSSVLAWRILMDKGTWQATVHGVAKSQDSTKPLSIRNNYIIFLYADR